MFESKFHRVGSVVLPRFSNTRVMMMPIVLADLRSLPPSLSHYKETASKLVEMSPCREGIGYLTIDEKKVSSGQTHRRAGLHVDGIYHNGPGGWGGGGGGWGPAGLGMLTVSNPAGCRAWQGKIFGWPHGEGECDHLANQLEEPTVFEANEVYWVDGMCVHESLPMVRDVERQFVRLSMPSTAPWFEGYTPNPMGVLPTGPILQRRAFM